jgi:hypothetical protein
MKKTLLPLLIAAVAGAAAAQTMDSTNAPQPPHIPLTVSWYKLTPFETYVVSGFRVCHNRFSPPVEIAPRVWQLTNPFEQTVGFICER